MEGVCSTKRMSVCKILHKGGPARQYFLFPSDLKSAQESKDGEHQKPSEQRHNKIEFIVLIKCILGMILPCFQVLHLVLGCLWKIESSEPHGLGCE